MRAWAFPKRASMALMFAFPISKSLNSTAKRSRRSCSRTIIHTGDYKVDETPVIGEAIDLRTLRRYGQEGVLALLSDSTNATVPGRTPSERAVIPAFEEIFAEARGRIIVAAFASSIHRLQIVFDVAQQFNRKVCVP